MKFVSLALLSLGFISLSFGQVLNSPMSSRANDPEGTEGSPSSNVLGSIVKKKPAYTREMVLGNILKGALEHMHLSNKSIEDKLSNEAFKLYLERIDYGKQFLLDSDVKELSKSASLFDDQLQSGQLTIIDTTESLLSKRINDVRKMVDDIMAKPFDYKKKETLETDPEKRKFAKNAAELRALWERILKYDTLGRIVDLKEERDATPEETEKLKKDKKKKRKSTTLTDGEDIKKMTDSEIEIKSRKKTLEAYQKIFTRLLEEKRNEKLDKFYNAITKVFDPHTNYLIPEEKEDFDIDMSGKLEGIGAILREEGSYIKVESVVPGSASWKTKQLDAEDVILKVAQGSEEPVEVVDMSLRDAVKLIRGKKGTEVRLTVKKSNGHIKTISIVRDVVEIEESYVKGTLLETSDGKQKYGYIFVPKFYRDFNDRSGRNCTDDTRKEIQRLKKENITGLILDLRNNGGGALEDARMISGLFIDKGPIVQVKASTGEVDVLKDDDGKIEWDKPLIVLINRFSASASEIVAAALQDYKRAVIVGGEFSHGKGTVQLVVDLDNYISPVAKAYSPLGALKITIQKFYRVTGSSTQYKGVTPDIVLPDPYAHLESGEQFLKHSIPWSAVKAVPHAMWTQKIDLNKLRTSSKSRIAKDARFKRLSDNIRWYKEQKDKSTRSLNMDDFLKLREEIKKRSEEGKEGVESKAVVIKSLDEIKDKVGQEKFDDYAKGLREDPVIEESVHILQDMTKG